MAVVPNDQFNFVGPSYQLPSSLLDCQRTINLYNEAGIGSSKNPWGLVGRPALTTFTTLSTSPARFLWAGQHRLFAAGGTHFYEVLGAGVFTDYGAMSGSSGSGYCQAQANGTQLLVMDSSAQKIYNANPGGPSMDVQNNGNNNSGAVALEYLAGFYFAISNGNALNGANPNQINSSNFLDGTTWNPLNYVIRTNTADLTKQLCAQNGLLWVLGEKNISAWYNAGNAGFPLATVQGSDVGVGILSSASLVKFYNTFMWLGADDRGYAQVYMMRGMSPTRVSNAAIENLIAYTRTPFGSQFKNDHLGNAWARGYQEAGHTFYCLTLVDGSNVPQSELVYDLTTGLWHERSYSATFNSWPVTTTSLTAVAGSTQVVYAGDGRSGKIFTQDIITTSDDGTAITYTRVSPHVNRDNRLHRHNRFELDCDIGNATPNLFYSNNGGRSLANLLNPIPLAQSADAIAPTTFQRFYAQQLGVSRDRVYEVTITDGNNLIRIADALLDVD